MDQSSTDIKDLQADVDEINELLQKSTRHNVRTYLCNEKYRLEKIIKFVNPPILSSI
jgi:hypothetical protein